MDALKPISGILAGGAAGYFWHRLAGCRGGCPLAGNRYVSVILGAVAGFLLATAG